MWLQATSQVHWRNSSLWDDPFLLNTAHTLTLAPIRLHWWIMIEVWSLLLQSYWTGLSGHVIPEPCSYFSGLPCYSWEGGYPLLNPSTFNVYSASLNHSEHQVVGTYLFDSNTILELSINLMSYSIPWLARPYPLLSTESSIFLRTMLPEKMIIPSVVLKLHNSIGQGQEVNTHLLFTVWHTHGQLLSPSEHLTS